MEVTQIRCPACCDKSFESKTELIEHLARLVASITCPVCTSKCSSYEQLIEHLTLDDCQHVTTNHTVLFDIEPTTQNDVVGNTNKHSNNIEQFTTEHFNDETHQNDLVDSLVPKLNGTDDETEIGKMYVELLSKQMAKPCLQTQEMTLVKDNGVSRYFIMTQDDSDMSNGTTVVTKQNNDGTISLTTVDDMKTEADTVITPENDTEDLQDELYSCNTCGVSFSSVLEHIQNYHNDQDVVVEDQMAESVEGTGTEGAVGQAPEVAAAEKQARRVITDTGDIVETPVNTLQLVSNLPGSKQPDTQTGINEEVVRDKDGRLYTRRYLHIDKFHDSFVKSTKQPEVSNEAGAKQQDTEIGINEEVVRDKEGRVYMRRYLHIDKFHDSFGKSTKQPEVPDTKNGRYHKVIQKEIKSTDGGCVKVYNCLTCGIYVTSLDEFKQRPCKKNKYKCSQCNLSYDNPKSLCAHVKVHKGKINTTDTEADSKVIYECSICTTEFPTNKSLKLHKRMHDPIKARPIEPPVENTNVLSADRYVCGVCGKLIPVDYRTVHENSHKDIEQFNCDICNKKFTAYEYLEMHLNVHSTEKIIVNKQDKSSLPYTCSYCERRFARPHEKVKHERIHTGEKPHSCEICGKSFRVSYCLTLHMRTHTGARPYACQHCGKRFKAHSVYNHHLLTHSEVRAYKCPYCPKAFKTSVQLAGHKNSHTKPFSCQHCNRPFASLYAVRAHTETHARQNNLKFACHICGAKYARAFALKDHIKQAHGEQVEDHVGDNVVNISLKDNKWFVRTLDEPEVEEVLMTKDEQLEQAVNV